MRDSEMQDREQLGRHSVSAYGFHMYFSTHTYTHTNKTAATTKNSCYLANCHQQIVEDSIGEKVVIAIHGPGGRP